MVRPILLTILPLGAALPSAAQEREAVRLSASEYREVPDRAPIRIAFADPAQKDADLEAILADRLVADGHSVVRECGYLLTIDYNAPQRGEREGTFRMQGGADSRGMDRFRASLNFQLSEPDGASGTSLTQAWMALDDPDGRRLREGMASTRRPQHAPFASPEDLLLPLVDRLGESVRNKSVAPN